MRALIILAAAGLLPCAAMANQPPPLHDVAFYAQNAGQRVATLRWCAQSAERSRLYDCQNAQAGANAARASRGNPLALFDQPTYYAQNPYAREMVRSACANPTAPGSSMYLRSCRYAQ